MAYALSHSALHARPGRRSSSQAPTAFIAPVAGVLVDRWDRHRTLVITQVLAMLQSAALAAFALTGHDDRVAPDRARRDPGRDQRVRHAGAAVVRAPDGRGLARTCRTRSRSTPRWSTPRACSARRSRRCWSRLVGVGWCFAIDAASYVAVIASLLAMRGGPRAPPVRGGARADGAARGRCATSRSLPLVRAAARPPRAVAVFGGRVHGAAARGRGGHAARRRAHARLADGRGRARARWPARSTWRAATASRGLGRRGRRLRASGSAPG